MANIIAMKLSEYLISIQTSPTSFAETIGVPASTITRLLNGDRSAGLTLALKIEDATAGKVTARELAAAHTSAGAGV